MERAGEKRDPHNTIVLVAAEWGIIGLMLYLGYYATYFSCCQMCARSALSPLWYYRSVAIQLAMMGVFVAGLFTDRLYAEAPYWMGALAVALHRLHKHEIEKAAATASAKPLAGQAEPAPRLRPAV